MSDKKRKEIDRENEDCGICNEPIGDLHHSICSRCDKTICQDCYVQCKHHLNCHYYFCREKCIKKHKKEVSNLCETCDKRDIDDELVDCGNCGKYQCSECDEKCQFCDHWCCKERCISEHSLKCTETHRECTNCLKLTKEWIEHENCSNFYCKDACIKEHSLNC